MKPGLTSGKIKYILDTDTQQQGDSYVYYRNKSILEP